MPRIEDIFDQAVKRVKNGEEISAVLLSSPKELREQLSANLNLVKLGLSLPKVPVPVPNRRMLFLQAAPQSKASRFSEFFNVYALALTAFVLILGGTSLAAAYSLPGERLFSLKRSFEATRLKLARNPEEQARLQLTFTNARLEEVNQILANKDSAQTNAAIAELNSQTEQALKNIQQIAADNPNVKTDPQIISSVKSLTTNQAQLVDKVAQAKPNAQVAASTQKTVANIQKLIAASNDQIAADLPASALINTAGTITAISDGALTVDKNSFELNKDTAITDKDGNKLTLLDIGLNDSVQVQGETKDQKNIATKITLESRAEIKTAAPAVPSKPAIKPGSDNDNNGLTAGDQNDDSQISNSNKDTFGGFIPEAPVGQVPAN